MQPKDFNYLSHAELVEVFEDVDKPISNEIDLSLRIKLIKK